MTNFDVLIVGQGLSGTTLASMLIDSGKRVCVIDHPDENSSSNVAAGLVNPITGRRVVKSWMADALIPFAKKFYAAEEEKFGTRFFQPMDCLEVIRHAKELNDWNNRLNEIDLIAYKGESIDDTNYKTSLTSYLKLIRITSSGWMNISSYLKAWRERLIEEGCFVSATLSESDLKINTGSIQYKDLQADRMIFCEGHHTRSNELWVWLPFLPAKGEILTIRCDLPQDFILLGGIFLIPLGNKLFRAGATYEWDYSDASPTEKGREKLIDSIKQLVKIPFEVMAHHAGIRPTVKDRRPIVGRHPQYSNVYILNGLGTKGVQFAPFFANELIDFMESGKPINGEVNVSRFYSLFDGSKK